ncbi:MAG: hypothetical protein Q8Q85_15990 [Gemmatimonadales bacterium]|nr:hypothetical protein [Gemmatimonadales bacterium]
MRILKLHLRKLKYVFDARVLAARLLDSYGNGARVEEYAATGNAVWRIEGTPATAGSSLGPASHWSSGQR